MKPSTTGKWQRSTNGATPWYTPQLLGLGHSQLGYHLGPGYSLDRIWYCCKPRPCWCCHPLRPGISWLCCRQQKIYTLAQAKRNSVNELVSQALADKQISDVEFRIITREVEKYHKLKAAIRSGVKAVSQEAATQTQGPDIEKLKEELRKEVKKEFQKKVNLLTAVSKSDLND